MYMIMVVVEVTMRGQFRKEQLVPTLDEVSVQLLALMVSKT